MARLGRTFLPDQPLHLIQRGNNRGAVLFGEDDYAQYGGWLAEAADGYGCRIHADVFMTNHVHLCWSRRSARTACRAPCNRWGDARCAPSTRRIAEPERSGRGAPGSRRSTVRLISSRAVARLN
jgi:REP element-mobilizing transposase RayT